MAQGWVSLNREVADHWVWNCEFSTGQAWVDLILHANHKPAKIMIKGQLVDVLRSQQARSELTLSKQWKWSRNKVRRFLKNLEKEGMIEIKSGHLTTIITICKYDDFQVNDTSSETPKKQLPKQQEDSRRDTNNNGNNGNNENNNGEKPKAKRFAPPELSELIEYFGVKANEKGIFINRDEPEKFRDFYESKNWYVGKNKMKDWKAAVRNWLGNVRPITQSQQQTARPSRKEFKL